MDDFETMKRMTDEYMEAEAMADLDRAISEWKRVETENVQLRAESDEDDAVIKRLALENMRLRSDIDALTKANERLEAIRAKLLKELNMAHSTLRECEEYFDNIADADCVGDPSYYQPNREMQLLVRVREALAETY